MTTTEQIPELHLEGYKILKVLGEGGFGVTYEALDVSLDTHVAIKEYFPQQFAERREGVVGPKPGDKNVRTFSWGLERFLSEGRTLAKCSHANIVRVTRYFEANGTAYLVMDFEKGQDLEAWLESRSEAISEDRIKTIIGQLLDGLETVHAQGLIHRDIKPSNIMIRADETPVLIDFGSARATGTDITSLTAVISPGYSPPELYSQEATSQGPWTDIYAISGVVYRMVTGAAPPDALARLNGMALPPVAEKSRIPISQDFANAVQLGLAERIDDRPQTIKDFRGRSGSGNSTRAAGVPTSEQQTMLARRLIETVPVVPWSALVLLLLAVLAVGAYWWTSVESALPSENAPSAQESQPSIALLPLRDLAGSSDLFGEAVSREIWSKLARVTGLRVISMTSSLQFVDSALAIQEVGRQLSADYIVEGSVMRGENIARVNVLLTRAGDGTTLWNASYTRTLDDAAAMFLLFDEISTELGQALPTQITGTANLEAPTTPPTNNLGSYNLLLQAKHEYARSADALRALELAKQAIALDPGYAHAQAEMGFYYLMMSEWGFGPPRPMLIAARDALTRSLELDPNWGNAHVYLGMVYDRLELDFGKAQAAYDRGRVLGADQDVYAMIAEATLLPAGRFEEALSIAEAAAERNPGDGWYRLSIGRFLQRLGRKDEALREYELSLSLSPDDPTLRSEVVHALVRLGLIGRARSVIEEGPTHDEMLESWLAFHEGNTKPMRDWVEQAIANREQEYVPAFAISRALYELGDYAAHMHWFRMRVEERDSVAWILDDIRLETDYWERMEEWSQSDEARQDERVELLRQHREFFEETTKKMVL